MELPDVLSSGVLSFHIPGEEKNLTKLWLDNPQRLYSQLVNWCLLQRYRYYVLRKPIASDADYDKVERYVKYLETSKTVRRSPHSPSLTLGSDDIQSYPVSIRVWFRL